MREIKFKLTYKRREDGHIWQLIVNPFEPGDGRRQMDSMLDNEEWQLIGEDQYTGLKDKNGEDIYEHDILEFKDEDFHDKFVIRCEDWIEFYVDYIGEPEFEDLTRDFYRVEKARKIGNIYENPELL